MFRVSHHPSSGVIKTVTAASGTGHNIGTATSFQHGQCPDLAMMEIISCISITPLTTNDPYSGRTAQLTTKVTIYIFIQQI